MTVSLNHQSSQQTIPPSALSARAKRPSLPPPKRAKVHSPLLCTHGKYARARAQIYRTRAPLVHICLPPDESPGDRSTLCQPSSQHFGEAFKLKRKQVWYTTIEFRGPDNSFAASTLAALRCSRKRISMGKTCAGSRVDERHGG